jgi:hypothetical protein
MAFILPAPPRRRPNADVDTIGERQRGESDATADDNVGYGNRGA